MRLGHLLAAAALLCCSVAARADDFTFTINGSANDPSSMATYSGVGTFSGTETNVPGTYRITSISGTNTNGLIDVNGYGGNDNLLMPNQGTFVDTSGIAFYDQTEVGVYEVRLFQSSGSCGGDKTSTYCLDVEEVNTSGSPYEGTLPVSVPGGPGSSGAAARFAVRFSLSRNVATPTAAATPEPGSIFLLGSGSLALVGMARRRFSRS